MKKLIGLCGFAGVGKDTVAKELTEFRRFAFADSLKMDLEPLFKQLGVDPKIDKEKCRPLMVTYGAWARSIHPDYWVNRLLDGIKRCLEIDNIVITDVRYINEVRRIQGAGGIVFRLHRSCQCGYCHGSIGPRNEEEKASFDVIDQCFTLKSIYNDKEPIWAASEIREALGWQQKLSK